MDNKKPIGLLGGTFDPVHHGHLRLALELHEKLDLSEIRLIPAARPPLRQPPIASAQLRVQMAQVAVFNTPGLIVDHRELYREGLSYTVDTLHSIRAELPEHALCLILGMDAFMGLPQWHQWEKLIDLAHLIVVRRLGTLLPTTHIMRDFLEKYQTTERMDLVKRPAGSILIEEIPCLAISATQIRTLLAEGKNPRYLLPDTVLDIIVQNQLYY